MDIKQALAAVAEGKNLSQQEAEEILASIMHGEATNSQIGGLLMGLRMKGETVEEIAGFVAGMRGAGIRCPVEGNVIDIVGTGGDCAGTFNISTTSAFVVAGAGGKVAKHGNRGVSSKSGAADVLGTLGVKIDMSADRVAQCVKTAGVGFLFAQTFHPAMKYVAPVRREMGVRTVFNLLGPLTNPAGTKKLVIGVYGKEWCTPLARALARLGTEKAWVVHGGDGLDEITTTTKTYVTEWDGKAIREFEIDPEKLGLKLAHSEDLKGGDAPVNAEIARSILNGEKGPKRDIVLLNAAAALTVLGVAKNLEDGLARAAQSIDSGAAGKALELLISTSLEP